MNTSHLRPKSNDNESIIDVCRSLRFSGIELLNTNYSANDSNCYIYSLDEVIAAIRDIIQRQLNFLQELLPNLALSPQRNVNQHHFHSVQYQESSKSPVVRRKIFGSFPSLYLRVTSLTSFFAEIRTESTPISAMGSTK